MSSADRQPADKAYKTNLQLLPLEENESQCMDLNYEIVDLGDVMEFDSFQDQRALNSPSGIELTDLIGLFKLQSPPSALLLLSPPGELPPRLCAAGWESGTRQL